MDGYYRPARAQQTCRRKCHKLRGCEVRRTHLKFPYQKNNGVEICRSHHSSPAWRSPVRWHSLRWLIAQVLQRQHHRLARNHPSKTFTSCGHYEMLGRRRPVHSAIAPKSASQRKLRIDTPSKRSLRRPETGGLSTRYGKMQAGCKPVLTVSRGLRTLTFTAKVRLRVSTLPAKVNARLLRSTSRNRVLPASAVS